MENIHTEQNDGSTEIPKATPVENGLVGAVPLLEITFPREETRPSLRWLREMQAKRLIPFRKIGRMTYFCPVEVRRALDAQFKVNCIGEK